MVGRKGWLFSDTPAGAEATAIVYTLMETAKANNLRLEDYIEHLLAVLPERFADDLEADIDDLLPWADAMQKRFAMFGTGTFGSMKGLCERMDSNIRYRLRMCIWKHWKTPQNRAKNLIKLGISRKFAWSTAYYGAYIAHVCQGGAMNMAVTKERLTRFGLVSMADYYAERCVTC